MIQLTTASPSQASYIQGPGPNLTYTGQQLPYISILACTSHTAPKVNRREGGEKQQVQSYVVIKFTKALGQQLWLHTTTGHSILRKGVWCKALVREEVVCAQAHQAANHLTSSMGNKSRVNWLSK